MTLETLVADARRVLNEDARYPTTDEVVAALNRAQVDYFGFLIGSTRLYQPGRPVPNVSAGLTARVEEELRPFKLDAPLTIATDGALPLPGLPNDMRFAYPLRLSLTFNDGTTTNSTGVKWLDEMRWDEKQNSLIAPPTIRYPIARTTAAGFQVLPKPATAKLTFYRYPKTMVLAISGQDANGNDVVDTANSVDCEWPALAHSEILRRAVLALSTQLADANAAQYAAGQAQTAS